MKKAVIVSNFIAAMIATGLAVADPVAVIVNSANTQAISQSDVKNIYQDKSTAWASGQKIAVYNLPLEDAAANTFASKILGSSARDAAAAESNRVVTNTSRNTQQTKRDALVVSIVAKTPHAIGYVPEAQVKGKSGIRVLFTLE